MHASPSTGRVKPVPYVRHMEESAPFFRNARALRTALAERHASLGELLETDRMDMFVVRDPDGHQIVLAETDPARHAIDAR